jgi:hypothetical protein
METKRPRFLDPQECALVLLRLLELRNEDSPGVSRVRLSELTLRRMWGRDRIGREFLEEVQEWTSRGGWSLFYAGTTYAAVRTRAVLSWTRLSSKRMADDLRRIAEGTFEFGEHLHLLANEQHSDD